MQLDVICWFLLTSFIGVFADKKMVEQGSSVILFQNVSTDNAEKEVNVFVNGDENPTLAVTFKFFNGSIVPVFMTDYRKISMDEKSNSIKIDDMDETYERKFYIQSSKIHREVELTMSKTNYSTTERTTQKGDALPETSYSTTERTSLQETTQKGDAWPGYAIALIVLMVIVILMLIIIMVKKPRIAWIRCKKSNSVPQPVQVTSYRDSPHSTSYLLMWDKPDDGGSPLIKHIIQYCEVEIIPDRTEYELSKYLEPFKYVDNILPSVVSYELSSLTPRRYYLVQIHAINTQGPSLKSFIFKTKEGAPQPVQVTSHRDSPDSTSYQLMWDKPDDGGSPLLKYILQYCEVEINPNGTEYELSKSLSPLVTAEILPSDVSYTLSPLKPGSYYQVEVQAVNSIGMSSERFIFKSKESAPKQAVEEGEPDFQLSGQHSPCPTSPLLHVKDETNSKVQRPFNRIEMLPPESNGTDIDETISKFHRLSRNRNYELPRDDDTVFTGKDEQKANRKSKKSTARNMKSSDSESSHELEVFLPEEHVDQN